MYVFFIECWGIRDAGNPKGDVVERLVNAQGWLLGAARLGC